VLPHRFRYHRPQSLEAVFDLLAHHGEEAALYAGGTELLLAMKARVLRYEHLIDLKRVPGLSGVREDGSAIIIGALSTHFSLAGDPALRRELPAYAELSDGIANIRVRVCGTIGGNLCFAEPHADPPALLAALGSTVTLHGPEGGRSIVVADFIEGEFTTVRAADEVLTEIRVPLPPAGARYAYRSFGHLERPAVGIAAGYLPQGNVARYRVWAGAIADRPIHLSAFESALEGVPPAALGDVLQQAAAAAAEALPAHDDLQGSADYKRHVAAALMRRAIEAAAGLTPLGERSHGRA
jgi:carbon-monoxide dehydrogenase medium subunit